MRKILSITLFLLPFLTAAGQTRVESHYTQIFDDSTSCFYLKRGEPNGFLLEDKYNVGGPYRIMTDKDTLVCCVSLFYGYRGYKKSLGFVTLDIEDQRFCTKCNLKHKWFANKDIRKLKRHYKIKIKAYRCYPTLEPEHTKKLTAYIDLRPFEGARGNGVHFSLKRGKARYKTKKQHDKIIAKRERFNEKRNEWLKKNEEKIGMWTKKFVQKYYIPNP